jgi:hypothetical protein
MSSKFKIASIFVFCVITLLAHGIVAQNEGTIVSVTPQVGFDTCEIRRRPGFICVNDCTTLARCVDTGDGWDTRLVKYCGNNNGLYCNEQLADCSSTPGTCNPGGIGGTGNFACTSVGIFPDPFDCRFYHACTTINEQLISFKIQCPFGSAFNPTNNECSFDMNHDVCTTPQFTCNTIGQMGVWPLNPNIYYICVSSNGVRFPVLYRCGRNMIFDLQQERCVQNNGGGIPGGGAGDFRCTSVGLFVDPTNCRFYFFCNVNMVAQRIQCPNGTYFHPTQRTCVIGNC